MKKKIKFSDLQDSDNINDLLDKEDSETIGSQVLESYRADKSSRERWEKQNEESAKLAMQIVEPKTYPWPNAANVKFPLVTIASMQFAARAYPALVKVPDLVKYRVQGKDEDGAKAARGQRISSHMSYQLLEEDEPWEENHDRALITLPVVGCVFKKSYYDKLVGHNRSTVVLPSNLVVHYYARSIEECERKTETFQLSPREIRERVLRKLFTHHDLTPAQPKPKDTDKRQGISAPYNDKDPSRDLLEQHCYLDLDDDGYKEPYVVTIDEATSKVFRIVSRWEKVTTEQSLKIYELQKRIKAFAEGLQAEITPESSEEEKEVELNRIKQAEKTLTKMQDEVRMLSEQKPKVLKIDPVEYYTKIPFIPSPDGGFYDLGFGALLGPLNESVNTILNQLLDAGHMATSGGGFIGKGARIKGGKLRFEPNEWIRVNVAGGTLKDSIVPLPVNEPSAVLFQLLSLLITYSERTSSVTDTMMGENPGQNTPAYNMSTMLEQGTQVFNGVFKRVYRSQRAEFRKLYKLNSIYLDDETYFTYQDSDSRVLRTDYHADPKDLIPAADPNAFSSKEKVDKAMLVTQRAEMVPGYDPIIVEKGWLSAMEIMNSDEVYPLVPAKDEEGNETGVMTLKFPPQPNPEFEIQREDLARKTLEGQSRHEAQIQELEIKYMLAEAEIMEKIAKAQVENEKIDLKALELQLDDMKSKREALTDVAVAEIGSRKKPD